MEASYFLYGALAVVAIAAGVMLSLRGALHALLVDLCGGESRARFWMLFWTLFVVLVALFGVLASMPAATAPAWKEHALLHTLLETVRAGMVALLCVLALLGFVLLRGIQQYETRRRRTIADRI